MKFGTKIYSRGEQLADAFVSIARANHYMVGLTERVTHRELDQAEQILIRWENDAVSRRKKRTLDLAFALLDEARKKEIM